MKRNNMRDKLKASCGSLVISRAEEQSRQKMPKKGKPNVRLTAAINAARTAIHGEIDRRFKSTPS